jgi:hypothetical protein
MIQHDCVSSQSHIGHSSLPVERTRLESVFDNGRVERACIVDWWRATELIDCVHGCNDSLEDVFVRGSLDKRPNQLDNYLRVGHSNVTSEGLLAMALITHTAANKYDSSDATVQRHTTQDEHDGLSH